MKIDINNHVCDLIIKNLRLKDSLINMDFNTLDNP